MPCVYIIKKGKNKGKQCNTQSRNGEECCARHIQPKPLDIINLPSLVLTHVVSMIINTMSPYSAFQKMCSMYLVCKDVQQALDEQWQKLLEKVPCENHDDMKDMTPKQKLHLLLDTGCQRCNRQRVKKIHWPFPIRVCDVCINKITISTRDLKREHNITEEMLQNIRFRPISYNSWYSQKEMHIYLKSDIRKALNVNIVQIEKDRALAAKNIQQLVANDMEVTMDELTSKSVTFNCIRYDSIISRVKNIICQEYYTNRARSYFLSKLRAVWPNDIYYSYPYHIYVRNKEDYERWLQRDHDEEIQKMIIEKRRAVKTNKLQVQVLRIKPNNISYHQVLEIVPDLKSALQIEDLTDEEIERVVNIVREAFA